MDIITTIFKILSGMWPVIAVLAVAVLLGAIFHSRWFKGKAGEVMVGGFTRLLLPEEYIMINNIMLPRNDKPELTTQIDHIIVSRYGLFVLETKNYRGKIYASPNAKVWTYYPGGKKTTFQNPLRQNYLHTWTLADILEIPHELVHSAIVFCGDSELTAPIEREDKIINLNGIIHYLSLDSKCQHQIRF
ncbi:MAG: NERD domain-containing protein [Phycisphaerae bacterium]|nr:NERD domain-containing protein [Phycisphaerae bacterium]